MLRYDKSHKFMGVKRQSVCLLFINRYVDRFQNFERTSFIKACIQFRGKIKIEHRVALKSGNANMCMHYTKRMTSAFGVETSSRGLCEWPQTQLAHLAAGGRRRMAPGARAVLPSPPPPLARRAAVHSPTHPFLPMVPFHRAYNTVCARFAVGFSTTSVGRSLMFGLLGWFGAADISQRGYYYDRKAAAAATTTTNKRT
jgi:hypothetical protein